MRTRGIVWTGSLILVVTGLFHGSGFGEVSQLVAQSDLEGTLAKAVPGLWLFASYHWIFIAVAATIATAFPSRLARLVLAASALVILADALVLLIFVGPFVGEALLAAAGVAFVLGAVTSKES